LITIAKFNHWGGRLYFIPVKPVHKMLAKSQLKKKNDDHGAKLQIHLTTLVPIPTKKKPPKTRSVLEASTLA
jgi:hypothetical protein